MSKTKIAIGVGVIVLAIATIAFWPKPITGLETETEEININATQTGIGSWYDYALVGDQKCTPEREPCYSKLNDTCASRDHQKGTILFVTHKVYSDGPLSVSRWVRCRVNDYGPEEWTGRMIDLSSHAFAQLAPLDIGVINVTVEVVK